MYDITGRLLNSNNVIATNGQLLADFSYLQTGIYNLKIEVGERIKIVMVIIE